MSKHKRPKHRVPTRDCHGRILRGTTLRVRLTGGTWEDAFAGRWVSLIAETNYGKRLYDQKLPNREETSHLEAVAFLIEHVAIIKERFHRASIKFTKTVRDVISVEDV